MLSNLLPTGLLDRLLLPHEMLLNMIRHVTLVSRPVATRQIVTVGIGTTIGLPTEMLPGGMPTLEMTRILGILAAAGHRTRVGSMRLFVMGDDGRTMRSLERI